MKNERSDPNSAARFADCALERRATYLGMTAATKVLGA